MHLYHSTKKQEYATSKEPAIKKTLKEDSEVSKHDSDSEEEIQEVVFEAEYLSNFELY